MDYRIFRPSFKNRDGTKGQSPTFHVEFKDHLAARRRVAGYTRQRDTEQLAGRIMDIVRCRRLGEALPENLRKWLDTIPPKMRAKLAAADLIDAANVPSADRPLLLHLDGTNEAPGYKQSLMAKGNTPGHVNTTVQRIRDLFKACRFILWRDITRRGAAGDALIWLGKQREQGIINGTTLNYYARDVRAFTRWLAKRLGRDVPLQDLTGVDNAESDASHTRELSAEEMRLLIAAAAVGPVAYGLTGEERASLYRFAFETGMRPGQIRGLVVSDFDLESETATVRSHARYVKRRREHMQVLKPALAADLAKLFKDKMPSTPAIRISSRSHMAEMLRMDLAAARETWIEQKGITAKERLKRQRSDFLAAVNHRGERAVFYSTRHGHGSALAAAGVPEKDIAESMHHASRATTRRYLHSRRPELTKAIASLPDVAYSSPSPSASRRKRGGA